MPSSSSSRGNEVEQQIGGIAESANLLYSPKRAMAELRHSSSLGSRASSSPMKRDGDSSPLIPDNHHHHHHQLDDDDHDDRDRHSSKDRDRPFLSHHFHSLCPFFNDDSRVSPHTSRISLFFIFFLVLVALISIFSIVNKWVSLLLLHYYIYIVLLCFFEIERL